MGRSTQAFDEASANSTLSSPAGGREPRLA
jgi:hypothetical protein